jgi:hypothetical protein
MLLSELCWRLRRALHYYYKESVNDKILWFKGTYVPKFERLPHGKTAAGESYEPLDFPQSVNLVILPFKTMETEVSRLALAMVWDNNSVPALQNFLIFQ